MHFRWFLTALLAVVGSQAHAALRPHFADAPLYAVQFVDRNEGWAVGAEGACWHSIDGGVSWERQPTGTPATLRGVHFVTPYCGWLVGRVEQPNGTGSVGVVLHTRDGGLKWERLSSMSLPGLHGVRFFDEQTGVAYGDGSDACPSGVFATSDGGRTWHPRPGTRSPGWRAADFSDPHTGVLAGVWGRLAIVRNDLLGAADVDAIGGRSVLGVQLNGPRAVAVGHGGLVLTSSSNAGVSWGFANLGFKPEVLADWDFHAVACKGPHIWAVGRPGSAVLHSADHGQHWDIQATGQNLPLHAVQFLNDDLGWAVGELGTIVRTTDGGKSWSAAQRGGQRAAMLCVHATGASVPLDCLAVSSGEDGYLSVALGVTCPDASSASARCASDSERLRAALRLGQGAGAEMGWQFPLPGHLDNAKPAEIMAYWDKLHGQSAADRMVRQLVLALRMWRPEVVVTDGILPTGHPATELVAEAVRAAFKQANDPKACPEHLTALGLSVWQPKKLYAECAPNIAGPVSFDLATIRPRLGDSAAEYAAPAVALVNESALSTPTSSRRFRVLATIQPDAPQHNDWFQSIDLAAGGTARRDLPALTEADMQAVAEASKLLRLRQTLQNLHTASTSGLGQSEQIIGQLPGLLAQLPPDQGARAAFAFGTQCVRAGQWLLAREAFLLLADRYPAHPLAGDAYRWLARYGSSSEARRRQELGQFITTGALSFQAAPKGKDGQTEIQERELKQMAYAVPQRSTGILSDNGAARQWYAGALAVEPRLAAFGAAYAHDPAMQFCFHAARRQLGDPAAATQYYSRLVAASANVPKAPNEGRDDSWRELAAAELWLSNRGTTPPRPLGHCKQSMGRPHLDGVLNDACWTAAPLLLKPNTAAVKAGYATRAWLSYDAEFLYIAVECKHPDADPVPIVKGRTRDADLGRYDRVSILLDLDRDYQTYYHLQIDQRGCLAEDCWGDRTWNPQWFVATTSDRTGWTAEAAIPLSELTGEPVTVGKVWAANVARIVPGNGVLSWSQPADAKPRPEGLGLLQFVPASNSEPRKLPKLD